MRVEEAWNKEALSHKDMVSNPMKANAKHWKAEAEAREEATRNQEQGTRNSYFRVVMQTAIEFFGRTKEFHVLVLGDIMLDRYIRGSVDRISPEAPVPVLHWRTTDNRLGGAANVALNLRHLGARVTIGGMTGEDRSSGMLRQLLQEEDIGSQLLNSTRHAPTTVKTRVISGHQHLLRIDEEEKYTLDKDELMALHQGMQKLWEEDRFDAIILQDYNKGFLSAEVIEMVMSFAHDRNIPVTVDPKEENFFAFKGAAIFKPNLRELRARIPFQVSVDNASMRKACDYLHDHLDCQIAAVTLSEYGIYLATGKEAARFPTKARTVVDVCGAGDAVISVLTLALLMGTPLSVMADLANIAGGVVCGHVGVCPVDVDQMRMLIYEHVVH